MLKPGDRHGEGGELLWKNWEISRGFQVQNGVFWGTSQDSLGETGMTPSVR